MSEKEQQNYRYDVETGEMNQNGTYSTETKKYNPGIVGILIKGIFLRINKFDANCTWTCSGCY